MRSLPTFDLVRTITTKAYHFYVAQRSGWAICTINDASYELSVQSDWGEWAHRWSADGMPNVGVGDNIRRMTFSEFIGARDSLGRCDYLADKLMKRDERERFCPRLTVGMRIRDARRIDRINRDDHIAMAREISEMVDIDDQRDFVGRWNDIEHADLVECEPWECFQSVPTNEYLMLRDAILPALVKALIAQRVPQHAGASAP